MAEVSENIDISATGADEASAALGKVSQGFEQIGGEHNKLAEMFGRRFEHVGLQLFVGEALRASGVGMETRGVIQILSLAMNSFGAAMGATVPIIMGVGAGLAVLFGLYQKIAEHAKKAKDEVTTLIGAEEKEIQSLNTSISTLESYNKTLGYLPETTMQLLEAKKLLRDFEAKEEIANREKEISALTALMAEEKLREGQLERLAAKQGTVTAGSLAHAAATEGLMGVAGGVTLKYTDWNKKIDENTHEYLKNNEQLKTANDRLAQLKGGGTETYEALAKKAKESQDASDKASREQITALERVAKAETTLREKEAGYLVDAAQQNANSMAEKNRATEQWYQKEVEKMQAWYNMEVLYINNHIKDVQLANAKKLELQGLYGEALDALEKDRYAKTLTAEKKMWDGVESAAASSIDSTANKLGQSFAKMAMEGKSFTEDLAHLWRDMAEMFIAEIIRMTIKYMAFLALTGGNTGSPMAKMFGFAEGGSMLVTRPTLMLAGEGGEPEVATFTPLSKMQSAGGGISSASGGQAVSIGTIQTNIYGITDPAQIADEVGRKIVQRIRGMGEIDFVRAS